MGLAILILGFSGSGKSASLRNFGADELALVNVNGKQLPFRTRFTAMLRSDDYKEITAFVKAQSAKTIAIDDAQYLMANEFMRRAKETGYQKFTDMAKNFWELVRLVETLPDDVIVYFLSHIETGDDGRQKAKTVGKMLDEKITVEGMFTTVLKTVAADGKYMFATQTDGTDTCKSPIGLFDTMYIPNDLKYVDDALRTYYSLKPEHRCEDCGEVIMPDSRRTVEQIVNGSVKNYGKKLCMKCVIKRVNEVKKNAPESLSE
jgi:hypothetical protein